MVCKQIVSASLEPRLSYLSIECTDRVLWFMPVITTGRGWSLEDREFEATGAIWQVSTFKKIGIPVSHGLYF